MEEDEGRGDVGWWTHHIMHTHTHIHIRTLNTNHTDPTVGGDGLPALASSRNFAENRRKFGQVGCLCQRVQGHLRMRVDGACLYTHAHAHTGLRMCV